MRGEEGGRERIRMRRSDNMSITTSKRRRELDTGNQMDSVEEEWRE